jgi:hypothetical protein
MAENRLEVIAPDGWKKEYVLQKPVIFIGSDPGNDIALAADDPTIAPRHLQLITDPTEGYRLVNLGDSEVWLGPAAEKGIPPHVSTPLSGNEPIKIGEFIITLRGEMWVAGGGPTNQSRNLGLNLSLPHSRLEPNQTLEGTLTVFNLGDHPGAQFELDLVGFDPDCYEIEPGPLLSSGADKEMSFWLYHRGQRPPAGEVTLTIWAAAPKAYPRERVTATRTITVMPFYQYTMRLSRPGSPEPEEPTRPVKPIPAAAAARPEPSPAPAKAAAARASTRPEPAEPVPAPDEDGDWWKPLPAAIVSSAEPEPEQPEVEIIPPDTETAEPVKTEAAADTIVSVKPPMESPPGPPADIAGEAATPPPSPPAPPADVIAEATAPPPPPTAQPAEPETTELEPPESAPVPPAEPAASQPPASAATEGDLLAAKPVRPPKQPAQYREETATVATRPTSRPTKLSSDLWAEAAESAPPSELWSDSKQESEPLKVRAKKYKPPPPKETEPEEKAAKEEPAAETDAASDSDDWWDDEL